MEKKKVYGRIYVDTFNALPKEWLREDAKGHKFYRVSVDERPDVGKYGETHSLRIILPEGMKAEGANKQKMFLADLAPYDGEVQVRTTQSQPTYQTPFDDPLR